VLAVLNLFLDSPKWKISKLFFILSKIVRQKIGQTNFSCHDGNTRYTSLFFI